MRFVARPYQEHTISMITHTPTTGQFLDMGLGKTVSTLTAINDLIYDYFRVARVLVVAPKTVAEDTWPTEIKKWDHLSRIKYSVAVGTPAERTAAIKAKADVYMINRENLPWLIEQYGKYKNKKDKNGFYLTHKWPFDMVVIDELQGFKDDRGTWYKMFCKVRPFISRLVILSGTPSPNGLVELWAPIALLDNGQRLGPDAEWYKQTFFTPSTYAKNKYGTLMATGYQPRPGAEEEIYRRIGDICISMKSEDHISLPDRIDNIIELRLDDKTRKTYIELEREYCLEFEEGQVVDAGSAAALQSKLHQLSQGAVYLTQEPGGEVQVSAKEYRVIHERKIQALDEIIKDSMGNTIIVFYWFKHDLDRLLTKFKGARVLKGTKEVKDWNAGKIPLLLAHPASAGHGLNLQDGGNIAVWFSLTWNLELYLQANKRLHRSGQKNNVIIHHLITRDTVDDDIMAALGDKEVSQERLLQAIKARVNKYK